MNVEKESIVISLKALVKKRLLMVVWFNISPSRLNRKIPQNSRVTRGKVSDERVVQKQKHSSTSIRLLLCILEETLPLIA